MAPVLDDLPPQQAAGVSKQKHVEQIVGRVEAQSADTHRWERWVSLTLNPFYA